MATLESFRENIGFKINMIFLTMAIANIVAPFVASQLADRYFSTERFLAFSHLVGGLFLTLGVAAALLFRIAADVQSFEFLFWVMLGHCLLYAPTVALTNSLAFHHLPNGEKDFGSIRLWGTIGWIVAGVVFGFGWLGLSGVGAQLSPPACRYTPNVSDCLDRRRRPQPRHGRLLPDAAAHAAGAARSKTRWLSSRPSSWPAIRRSPSCSWSPSSSPRNCSFTTS